MKNGIVHDGGKQIVRAFHCWKVVGKMEINVIDRMNAGKSAAGSPAFDAETGPSDGSLKATMVDLPILARACASPMDTVVFPSPAGVGVMAETRIKDDLFRRENRRIASSFTLAL